MFLSTLQLLAGEHPFKLPNRMIGALILAIITGRRPSRPADANMHIWFLAEQCWQQDMSLRPTMHAIYLCLSPFCQLDPASMRYVYEMPSAEFDEAAYNATLRRPPPSSDTTALNPIIEVFAESSIDEELDVRFDLGLSFTDDGVGPDTIELGSHIYPTLGDNGGGEDLIDYEESGYEESELYIYYMRRNGDKVLASDSDLDFPPEGWQAILQRQVVQDLMNIAQALKCMHESKPPKIHGNVRRESFTSDTYASDLLRSVDESTVTSLSWTAPELLNIDEAPVKTTATDVFAFGMTIIEVFTFAPPFKCDSRYRYYGSVLMAIVEGGRPIRPSGMNDRLWEIAQACWSHDPNCRPSMRDVQHMLRQLA